jgi:putative nucleotidyltransferase with HDIG domain
LSFQNDASFWSRLSSSNLIAEISQWEPDDTILFADEACFDRIAEAFAAVVDAKSPWTYQHSTRVAEIAVGIAREFRCPPRMVRDLRRAALLHDIGKLGVSNLILDKPGKPTDDEFRQIRQHAEYSHRILQQVDAFRSELATVASAHHERLDGNGYHLGLSGEQIHFATRILAVADIFEAMSARRPYRDAMEWERIEQILKKDINHGLDGDCVEALCRWRARNEIESRVEAQLEEVDRLLSEL